MCAAREDDAHIVQSVLDVVGRGKIDQLVVDDLTPDDVQTIAWSGSPTHLRSVHAALQRVPKGEVEYLALRAPAGEAVATGGIDYTAYPDAGALWQLATHPQLRSMGLGTRLIADAEARILRRGLRWAVLGVEDKNPRARALYERLGYQLWKREHASWDDQDEDGNVYRYETESTMLRKDLIHR